MSAKTSLASSEAFLSTRRNRTSFEARSAAEIGARGSRRPPPGRPPGGQFATPRPPTGARIRLLKNSAQRAKLRLNRSLIGEK